jgi:ABC-type amino acid transport substrate-binding protein
MKKQSDLNGQMNGNGTQMTRRNFLAGAAASAGMLVLAGCSGSGSDSGGSDSGSSDDSVSEEDLGLVTEGTLTVASDLAFPPFDSLDDDGNPTGFDVDVSYAIADILGLECEYLAPQNFDTIIPTIVAGGKADIGNSAFTITAERKEEVYMTESYLDANLAIAVGPNADKTSSEALNVEGVKVAVQSGTTGEEWARENMPETTVVTLDDPIQAMTGVQQGLYDACCADEPVLSYLVTNSYTNCTVCEKIPTGDQYGIVVNKDNDALCEAVNDAVKQIKEDGTLDDLELKWFGTDLDED